MNNLYNFGQKKIHNHVIEGEFKYEKDYVKTRLQYENLLVDQMRSMGRVPILDMSSSWTTFYDEKNNKFMFKLTMHSVYVGPVAAQKILGMESTGKIYLI